jgi:hypothetical protein
MTVTVSGSNGITFADSSAQNRGGKWGQIVRVPCADRYSASGTNVNYTPLGPQLFIRPSSIQSKILLIWDLSTDHNGTTWFTYLRNGMPVSVSYNNSSDSNINAPQGIITESNYSTLWAAFSMVYLDSPTTTGLVKYQLGMYGSNTFYLNDYGAGNRNYFMAIEILP